MTLCKSCGRQMSSDVCECNDNAYWIERAKAKRDEARREVEKLKHGVPLARDAQIKLIADERDQLLKRVSDYQDDNKILRLERDQAQARIAQLERKASFADRMARGLECLAEFFIEDHLDAMTARKILREYKALDGVGGDVE